MRCSQIFQKDGEIINATVVRTRETDQIPSHRFQVRLERIVIEDGVLTPESTAVCIDCGLQTRVFRGGRDGVEAIRDAMSRTIGI